MKKLFNEFVENLMEHNKEKCVQMVLDCLSSDEINVVDLYTEILTPALNNFPCHNKEDQYCIWEEHVKTAIVRTVIECCYPYVLKARNDKGFRKNEKIVVICPQGENHDLGAKMVADFFTIEGYDTTFVGANTPEYEFIDLINLTKPDVVALSVTNYFNLVSTKATIKKIKASIEYPLDIIVGGNAFYETKGFIFADDIKILRNYQDIKEYSKGDCNHVTTP